MKKLFYLLAITIAVSATTMIQAQVTIGSNLEPDANAVLDLQSTNKGLLLPRVALSATTSASPLSAHVNGMTVYNTATAGSGSTYVSPGFYYNDGTKWIRLAMGATNWFYMPSVSFDTSTSGTGKTKDLYAEYSTQFNTPAVKSTTAPAAVPYIPAKEELYYYIPYYDTSVFANVSIDDNGVMTYDVIATPTVCSYINIIFVLK